MVRRLLITMEIMLLSLYSEIGRLESEEESGVIDSEKRGICRES